jgi:hypothetical protein
MSHKINRPVPATVLSRRARARAYRTWEIRHQEQQIGLLFAGDGGERTRKAHRPPAGASIPRGWLAGCSLDGRRPAAEAPNQTIELAPNQSVETNRRKSGES